MTALPVPDQQSSAKPCGALLSKWGNPFSYSQPRREKAKRKMESDKGKVQSLGGARGLLLRLLIPTLLPSSAVCGGINNICSTFAS